MPTAAWPHPPLTPLEILERARQIIHVQIWWFGCGNIHFSTNHTLIQMQGMHSTAIKNRQLKRGNQEKSALAGS
jgi:hypothetical protein